MSKSKQKALAKLEDTPQQHGQRQYPRASFFAPVKIFDPSGNTLVQAYKGKLSPKGVGLFADPQELKVGEKVVLGFEGTEIMAPFMVRGTIASVVAGSREREDVCGVGIRFTYLGNTAQEAIYSYLTLAHPEVDWSKIKQSRQ